MHWYTEKIINLNTQSQRLASSSDFMGKSMTMFQFKIYYSHLSDRFLHKAKLGVDILVWA